MSVLQEYSWSGFGAAHEGMLVAGVVAVKGLVQLIFVRLRSSDQLDRM